MARPADRIRVLISLLAVAAGIGCGFLAVRLGVPRSVPQALASLALASFALAFVGAGAFAILGRRAYPARAEATTFLLGALFAAFIAVVGIGLQREPVTAQRDELLSVRQDRGRRHDNIDVRLRGHAEPLRWDCRTRRCADAGPLLALGEAAPVAVEVTRVGNQIVGLSAGGRHYLDAQQELKRVRTFATGMVVGGGLGALALVWFGLRRLRGG